MKVTDIRQQTKRADRYSIYIDGKYSFSLSKAELVNRPLRIGQEFDRTELEQAQQRAAEDKAYMRALELLLRRPRSAWEMQQYLKRKCYDNNITKKILNKLSKRELLNDKKFAEFWVTNRRLSKPVSNQKLKQELQQKRISHEVITQVLNNDETDERAVLKQLVAKKRKQTRYQDERKLTAYLLRQGFSYRDVKHVLSDC